VHVCVKRISKLIVELDPVWIDLFEL